jgi:sulfane dehydrogenase subunit SoxC
MTPLQHQLGIVTPNGLFFERHHAGVPDIDPDKHQLVIHGMVKQPLKFSMSDLMRYPSVSKIVFLECSGNGLTDWTKAASTTVQQSHGLLSCAQWTGVPVSALLDEAGSDPAAKWVLFEGADGSAHARSIPIEKVMADTLLVYGQNGERLRPEQATRCAGSSPVGKATYRSSGSGASRYRTSLGTCAARPRATPIRCPKANGGNLAS